MKPFKYNQLTISKKLGFILALFLLLALINYLTVNHFKNLQKDDAPVVDASGRNRMLSQKIAFYAALTFSGDESAKEELAKTIKLHNVSLRALKSGGVAPGIGDNKELPPTGEDIMPVLLKAEMLWETYKENAELIAGYTAQHQPRDSTETLVDLDITTGDGTMANSQAEEAFGFIKEHAAEMLKRNNTLVQAYVKKSKRKQQALEVVLIALLGFNLIVGVFSYFLLVNAITKPIKRISSVSKKLALGDISERIDHKNKDEIGEVAGTINNLSDSLQRSSEFAKQIGEGRFEFEFQALSEKDELGKALMTMRDRLRKVSAEDKKRGWAAEGLAKFGEILRKNQHDPEKLAFNLITTLVKYLNANQGGLFLVNNDNEKDIFLELVACYAWDRKKFMEKRIELGEGLAGQCWQEGKQIYLTQVPDDYINIKSGLGGANPSCVLVMPLKVNEEIHGIIELASFRPLKDFELDFVEKLGENIASAIANIKTNQRTRVLLEESQKQAEELRAQEEEMRQNAEELQSTQEATDRKLKEATQELEAQIKEIEAEKKKTEAITEGCVDGILTFDNTGKIGFCNPAAAEIWQRRADAIVGQNIREFIPLELVNEKEGYVAYHLNGDKKKIEIRTKVSLNTGAEEDLEVLVTLTQIDPGDEHVFALFLQKVSQELVY